MSLRDEIIRLANQHPETRRIYAAFIQEAAGKPTYKDYVEKKRKKNEKPLKKDQWEVRVLGKKPEGKSEGGSTPDPNEKIKFPAALGELMSSWHSSGGDPIYQMSSHISGGHPIPRSVAEAAQANIRKDLGNPNYSEADKKELQKIDKAIDKVLGKKAPAGKAEESKKTPPKSPGKPPKSPGSKPTKKAPKPYTPRRSKALYLKGVAGYHATEELDRKGENISYALGRMHHDQSLSDEQRRAEETEKVPEAKKIYEASYEESKKLLGTAEEFVAMTKGLNLSTKAKAALTEAEAALKEGYEWLTKPEDVHLRDDYPASDYLYTAGMATAKARAPLYRVQDIHFDLQENPPRKKYPAKVQEVVEKHDLTDADADAVKEFKKNKPSKGKSQTDQQLMQKFLAKAKPETKERMKGMTPAEFKQMLAAIMDEEEGGGTGKTVSRLARKYLTVSYPFMFD
jgi:hypothetical protein